MTRIVKEHDERREEILDTAQQLFSQKGYEQTAVQDITTTIGIAKGTFYHYFASKLDLLDELIERMIDFAISMIEPIIADPDMSALEKLDRFLDSIARWKLENKVFFLDIMRPYFGPDNTIFRQKANEASLAKVAPLLAKVINQGMAEGVFDIPHPVEVARVVLRLSQGLGEETAAFLLNGDFDSTSFDTLACKLVVYHTAVERLLKAPAGSIELIKLDDLRKWFE
jgi:AcrR family transcriptional regulator